MTLDPKIDNVEVINRGAIFGNINWVKFGMKHALRESEKDPQLKSVGRIGLVADLELEEHDDYYFERVWLGDKEYKKDRNLYEQYQKNYVCSKTCFMGYLDQKDLKKVVLRSKEIEKSLNMMFLQQVYPFSSFEECYKIANLISRVCEEQLFKRGETVLSEDTVNPHFYVVKQGSVKLTKKKPGLICKDSNTEFLELNGINPKFFHSRSIQTNYVNLKLLGKGSILNFENTILNKKSKVTAVVESQDTILLKLSGERIRIILQTLFPQYKAFVIEGYLFLKKQLEELLEQNLNLVYKTKVQNTIERRNLVKLKSIKKRKEIQLRSIDQLEFGPKNHFGQAWDKFVCQGFVSTVSKIDENYFLTEGNQNEKKPTKSSCLEDIQKIQRDTNDRFGIKRMK